MENKTMQYVTFIVVMCLSFLVWKSFREEYMIKHVYTQSIKEIIREYNSHDPSCGCFYCDILTNEGDMYYTSATSTEMPLPPLQYSYTPTGTF